jgi:hypothetical protein
MRNTADVTGGKPIAVLLQSISGVSAFRRLLRHPWRKETGAILLFCLGHHTSHKHSYIQFVCKYIHIIHRKHPDPIQTDVCTQMFVLCGNRTRNLLRSRWVFRPLRQFGVHYSSKLKYKARSFILLILVSKTLSIPKYFWMKREK